MNNLGKTKEYWLQFYEIYDTLPLELKEKVMYQEFMPTIGDLQELKENEEIEEFFNDLF